VTVGGLLTGDKTGVGVTATWSGGQTDGTTDNSGVATLTGIPAGEALFVSVTAPTHYTTSDSAATPKSVTALTANQQNQPVSLTVAPDKGSIVVTASGPGAMATETVTATVTWNSGTDSASANRTGTGTITVPNLPPGIALTITVTSTGGFTGNGDKAATLTAGETNHDVGTVNFH
jgi:hypothetical protein